MRIRTIYQTLEDRANPDEIIFNGPFSCTHGKSWLGKGYYFWENYIENAHWWGEMVHSNNYIICSATIKYDNANCLDLVDNREHIQDFRDAYEKCIINKSDALVPEVIAFMEHALKRIGKKFPYAAIRIVGQNSRGGKDYKVSFDRRAKSKSYFEFIPPLQICIKDMGVLNFNAYKVVHPKSYVYDDDMLL